MSMDVMHEKNVKFEFLTQIWLKTQILIKSCTIRNELSCHKHTLIHKSIMCKMGFRIASLSFKVSVKK